MRKHLMVAMWLIGAIAFGVFIAFQLAIWILK